MRSGSDSGGCRLGEFGRIARYLRPLAAGAPGALDLTDDAALLPIPPGQELVVTTDAMVAGIHFLPDDPPADIAAKLLRVNLSDLAAMAADPVAYTLVTALPANLDESWLAAFCAGLAEDQRRYGVHLLGGDSVATAGPITLAITAFGRVPAGGAVTRRSPADADVVCVTGTIGDAALGLLVRQGRLEIADPRTRDVLVERLRRPEPRLPAVPLLRRLAGAAIDVSDGLVADLGHIARVSGRSAVVEAARVPLSPATRAVVTARPDLLATLLTGGDDYELVFTVPARAREPLFDLARHHGVAVSEIGRLVEGPPGQVEVRDADGRPVSLGAPGWSHF